MYYSPLNCEADFYKSVYNKQDLIYLITKYGKNALGSPYRKSEFKSMHTTQLRTIWWKVEGKLKQQ